MAQIWGWSAGRSIPPTAPSRAARWMRRRRSSRAPTNAAGASPIATPMRWRCRRTTRGSSARPRCSSTTGTRKVHDFGPGRHPGEFVFVPASPDAAEDEGYLIGPVVDLPGETTDLVILDARSFTGPPIASVRLPHHVPPGFHGNWLPSAA